MRACQNAGLYIRWCTVCTVPAPPSSLQLTTGSRTGNTSPGRGRVTACYSHGNHVQQGLCRLDSSIFSPTEITVRRDTLQQHVQSDRYHLVKYQRPSSYLIRNKERRTCKSVKISNLQLEEKLKEILCEAVRLSLPCYLCQQKNLSSRVSSGQSVSHLLIKWFIAGDQLDNKIWKVRQALSSL